MLNESLPTSGSATGVLDVLTPSAHLAKPVILGSLLVILGAIVTRFLNRKADVNGVPTLRGPPIFGHFRFFSNRYDFVNDGIRKLGSPFQFNVMNYKVIAVSGEQARKAFLSSGTLSFRKGYATLHGSIPSFDDIGHRAENANSEETSWFQKRVVAVLRKDRLEKVLPQMFNDLYNLMSPWGDSGRFDPLDDIYKMVFQLTVRVGGCREIADNPAKLKRLVKLFWTCEKTTSATTVLLKWWPNPHQKMKRDATREMYQMMKDIVVERRQSGRKEDDTMQVLIDEGNSDNDIAQFIITTLFAGIVNTGMMSAWMMMYLGTAPEWKSKVIEEVQSLVAKYIGDADPSENLAVRLSRIPSSVWEEEMNVTDLCLRETIRIVFSSVFLRRSTLDELDFEGVRIKRGTFLCYPSSDVHHNPEIYPDPLRFDPSRYERQEDRKQQFAFVGWGAGRHPCLGMRFAKLEVKCIMAMFLTGYDYEVVNESGDAVKEMPEPDRNILFDRTKRPGGKPIYVKYQRVLT